MKIRVAGFVNDSIVDGPGIRYTIFTQGCKHDCGGCHNKHTHDLKGGYLIEIDEILDAIKKNPLLDGITISGGEPFLQAIACAELASKAKKLNLDVITYTGFTFEQLILNEDYMKLLNQTDILIDGPFIEKQKSLSLLYKGSRNQRIIDVKESLDMKRAVECSLNEYGEINKK